MPCATSARCANAVTDPLPFVPAMCSEEKLRSGWPRAAHRVCMFCRPSLIPKFSSANRRSRDKGEVASYKLPVREAEKTETGAIAGSGLAAHGADADGYGGHR